MYILQNITLAILIGSGRVRRRARRAREEGRPCPVGGKASLYYLPLTIAEHWATQRGLNLTISDFAGGSQREGGVAEAPIRVGGTRRQHATQGQYLQCSSARLPQIAIGIASARRRTTGRQGLKGLKVGVSAPGSSRT